MLSVTGDGAAMGLAIVISPLIALMKNQVDQMNAYGVNARFLNSTLSKGEITRLKKDCMNGNRETALCCPGISQ